MPARVQLDNISIVLHKPRYSENIGAVARSMRNMGINHLVVVDPPKYELEKVVKLATHVALDIIENIKFFTNLQDALAPYNYVVGATARLGGQRQIISSPSQLAQKLIAISKENRIAILFGTENRGLTNEDIRYCHTLVNIPTAELPSINLAQAVMILCYEIFMASRQETEEHVPRLARRHELDGMYAQLKDILIRINYINPENPDYWMNKLRHFFTRLQLRAKEVSMIRGLCRQVNWYADKCYQNGLNQRPNTPAQEKEP